MMHRQKEIIFEKPETDKPLDAIALWEPWVFPVNEGSM
jgi:hypothetical protein